MAVAIIATTVFAAQMSAATVRFTLDLSVPNEFKLYAEASIGDNDGLFFYGAPLLGQVTSLDHVSPNAVNGLNFQPAGFGELRSADLPGGAINPEIVASQPLFGPPQNIIHGLGQTPGTWPPGIVPLIADPPLQVSWSVPLLLATGTYTGTLDFNTSSLNFVANVISDGPSYPAAEVTSKVIPIVPEPSTVMLLSLASLGMAGLIRRRMP
jgi:hypothetical protein